ncbi:MAG: VWA domain-containing protein [Acidobacteriaceae bacterium]|jgi:Mg-chelatase subunit ChlD|nr:VWA domain-containing protein [Acidobacteriaceae bacterium]
MKSAGVTLTLAILAAGALLHAQQPLFRASTDTVEVDVSVMRGNAPVAGLAAENFEVSDNGVLQQVTAVHRGDIPLKVSLVLDVSASVSGDRLKSLIEAGHGFVNRLHPDDRVSLLTFSHRVRAVVPFGPPSAAIHDALDHLSGGGLTALCDAVQLALTQNAQENARSLIIVFSDGLDTISWLSSSDVLATAKRSPAVLDIVRFNSNTFLDQLAEATGGRTWSATSNKQLASQFTEALDEMRARYVLEYTLSGPPSPGWHPIKVTLKNARGEVRARPGYTVASASAR